MPQQMTDAIVKQAETALETRLEGNELFKSGDLVGALQRYHSVLFALRGTVSQTSAMCKEVQEDDEDDVKEEKEFATKVKRGLVLTYLNMAAIQIKREQYAKALEYARASLKLDPSTVNIKAKFREGQALIGLGQATAGRIVLEEIQTSLLGGGKQGDPIVHQTLLDLKKSIENPTGAIRGKFNAGAALGGAGQKMTLDNVAKSPSPPSPAVASASSVQSSGGVAKEEQVKQE